MGGYFAEALIFLVQVVFGLYILCVALRFLLQWVRADFYNPISQFVITATNPPLRPLRRWIPGYGGIDIACLVLLIVLQSAEIAVVGLLSSGHMLAPLGLFVLSIAELCKLFVYVFLFAIFVQVVLSWVNPGAYNPATVLLYRLTEPLLRPARRWLPAVGGLDFSPLLVIIGLQLVLILFVKPLTHWGYSLAGYLF